jgi:pantoate--beta-alanine ligase
VNVPSTLPVLASVRETRAAIRAARAAGHSIGLVPTMGALHDGHVQLIRSCRQITDFVVVSIYVNPKQFGPDEDFRRYPRTPDADRARCAEGGAELIFMPTDADMYPLGPGNCTNVVVPPAITGPFEGASRPGHFDGVATVVLKLLNVVQPDVAAFGQKDFQQLQLVNRMVADLDLPVRILPVPTVREPDGLAMSSRNRYLDTPARRAAALSLSRGLRLACEAAAAGERDAERVRQILRAAVESEALVQLDYAAVADAATLEPLAVLEPGRPAVALVAAKVDGVARLIDNALLPG